MIHTIVVTPETDPTEYRKQFRKKLMTGGAVVRLSDDLQGDGCRKIYEKFEPLVEEHGIAAEVIRQLARHPLTPKEILPRMKQLGIKLVDEALQRRTDVD